MGTNPTSFFLLAQARGGAIGVQSYTGMLTGFFSWGREGGGGGGDVAT